MKIFEKAKWIWRKDAEGKNVYVLFKDGFSWDGKKEVFIKLSFDGVAVFKINGKTAFFSGCADYPHYKYYDELNITEYLSVGENAFEISVWYSGEDSQTYILAPAGLIYEVNSGDNVLCFSSAKTLSAVDIRYIRGEFRKITLQLGYSFSFDNRVEIGEFAQSTAVKKKCDFVKRKIKPLTLLDKLPVEIKEGEVTVIDLKKETTGFFSLDIDSEEEQKITFSYGEDLVDGRVQRILGSRDFSFDVTLKKGKNEYENLFRRIAGRFIEFKAEKPVKVNYVGVKPVFYPVETKAFSGENPLAENIYGVSVYTLKLCMHEHYEDCPWREQALYTMDSRNQMLCGYFAFKSTEYQRENILLISKGLRKDGLLSLCFPAGLDFPIPSFSLAYFISVSEYIKYTGDKSVLAEVLPVLKKIKKTFMRLIDGSGLIPALPYPFWNFYEWSDGSDNENEITRKKSDPYTLHYDLILNCMLVYALKFYDELTGEKTDTEKIKSAIKEKFFDKERGVFTLSDITEKYSQLGNAHAVLIGLGDKELAEKILKDENMITATLSMRAFLYDALLTFKGEFKDYIVNDIYSRYKSMLDKGATSFWETEKGKADFNGAGSLCHGWSAIPVYYLSLFGIINHEDGKNGV